LKVLVQALVFDLSLLPNAVFALHEENICNGPDCFRQMVAAERLRGSEVPVSLEDIYPSGRDIYSTSLRGLRRCWFSVFSLFWTRSVAHTIPMAPFANPKQLNEVKPPLVITLQKHDPATNTTDAEAVWAKSLAKFDQRLKNKRLRGVVKGQLDYESFQSTLKSYDTKFRDRRLTRCVEYIAPGLRNFDKFGKAITTVVQLKDNPLAIVWATVQAAMVVSVILPDYSDLYLT